MNEADRSKFMAASSAWHRAIYAGASPFYTDHINRTKRHCRIGRIKPTLAAWAYFGFP